MHNSGVVWRVVPEIWSSSVPQSKNLVNYIFRAINRPANRSK